MPDGSLWSDFAARISAATRLAILLTSRRIRDTEAGRATGARADRRDSTDGYCSFSLLAVFAANTERLIPIALVLLAVGSLLHGP